MKENSSIISTIVKGIVFICCIAAVVIGITKLHDSLNSDENDAMEEIKVTGADGTTYTSYRTACSNGDFDAAREYVEKMKDLQVKVGDNDLNANSRALSQSISEAEEYIFSSELNALASMNDEQANTRIILVLNEIKSKGTPVNEGTIIGKDCQVTYSICREGDHEGYKKYISWVADFNDKCNRILDIAIACGNRELAEKVMTLIRPDATFYYKPSSSRKKNDYYYEEYKDVYAHYTTDSKDAAQKKYDEAVKSGAFDK